MKKRLDIKLNYRIMYFLLTIFFLGIISIYIFEEGGGSISRILFHDPTDCGNDFFNCIPAVFDFGLGYGLVAFYPPLAKLFFIICGHIIGKNNVDLSIAIRNSMTDIRMNQAALFIYILFIVVTSLLIVFIGMYIFENTRKAVLISSLTLSTSSVLFTLERGNIIYLSFMFLLFFVVFYNSDNRVLRELALIALALSAGIKLYPAVFGIILITEKRWWDALRACVYGLFAIIVPAKIISFYGLNISKSQNFFTSLRDWATYLLTQLVGPLDVKKLACIILLGSMLIIGLAIILVFSDKQWIKLFILGVFSLAVGVQFAYPYAWMFLIPSLLYFLKDEVISIKNNIYFVLLCVFHVPLPIFGERYSLTLSKLGRIKEIDLFFIIFLLLLAEIIPIVKQRLTKYHQ